MARKKSALIDSRIKTSEKLIYTVLDNLMRQQIGQLKTYVEGRFSEVNEKFAEINEKFVEMNAKFAEIDARFAEVNAKFAQQSKRLDSIEEKLDLLIELTKSTSARVDMIDRRTQLLIN